MSLNPKSIRGNWSAGYVLDKHTISSEYVGENEFGHPIFETERSDLGQLLYELKYRHNKSKVHEIIEMIHPFVNQWIESLDIDGIIAVPPSNKNRIYQPVDVISKELSSSLGIYYFKGFLSKNSNVQAKNDTSDTTNSMVARKKFKRSVNVLILDDLFNTGTSLKEASRVVSNDPNVKNIYVLALTRTGR